MVMLTIFVKNAAAESADKVVFPTRTRRYYSLMQNIDLIYHFNFEPDNLIFYYLVYQFNIEPDNIIPDSNQTISNVRRSMWGERNMLKPDRGTISCSSRRYGKSYPFTSDRGVIYRSGGRGHDTPRP